MRICLTLAGIFCWGVSLYGATLKEDIELLKKCSAGESVLIKARQRIKFAGRRAVEPLSTLLEKETPCVVHALIVYDQLLSEALRSSTRLESLRKAISPYNDRIMGLAGAENFAVRYYAVKLLGRTGDEKSIPVLAGLLKKGEPRIAERSALSIVELSSRVGIEKLRPALPALGELTKSAEKETASAACQALGELGDENSLPVLLEAVRREEPKVFASAQEAVIRILERFKKAGVEQLHRVYNQADREEFVRKATQIWKSTR